MALSTFPQLSKLVELGDGTRYTYAYAAPATSAKATFLFLHGFPSSSHDWRHQIEALKSQGFGIVAPDLLGYGDTDGPVAVEAYSMKRMSDHLAEILAKENVKQVIAVGHDWGSGLLSRFYTWHPQLVFAAVFISVGYVEPSGAPMDIDGINAITQRLLGYPTFGYWKLFETEEAGKLLDSHPDSTMSLFYPEDPEIWKTHLAPIGAAEAWIASNKITPRPSWLTEGEVAMHKKIIAQKGYSAPLNWYKSAIRGIDAASEASIPETSKNVNVPTLLILGTKDYVTIPEAAKQTATAWIKQHRIEEISCGHWIQLEQPEKVNDLLAQFASEL